MPERTVRPKVEAGNINDAKIPNINETSGANLVPMYILMRAVSPITIGTSTTIAGESCNVSIGFILP